MNKHLPILASVLLSVASISSYADTPNLELDAEGGYTLEIPMVDVQGGPGLYQNVIMKSSKAELSWSLYAADIALEIQTIEKVEIVTTAEIPVQVLLKIAGTYGSGCAQVGRPGISLKNKEFIVKLYYDPMSLPPKGPRDCGDIQRSFAVVIPLPVYGIGAGSYGYSVNNKFTGTFEIFSKNVIPQ